MIGDAVVYKDDVGRELRAFGQVGLGDPRVNRFGLYTGGGVSLTGAIPGRQKDQIADAMEAGRQAYRNAMGPQSPEAQ